MTNIPFSYNISNGRHQQNLNLHVCNKMRPQIKHVHICSIHCTVPRSVKHLGSCLRQKVYKVQYSSMLSLSFNLCWIKFFLKYVLVWKHMHEGIQVLLLSDYALCMMLASNLRMRIMYEITWPTHPRTWSFQLVYWSSPRSTLALAVLSVIRSRVSVRKLRRWSLHLQLCFLSSFPWRKHSWGDQVLIII